MRADLISTKTGDINKDGDIKKDGTDGDRHKDGDVNNRGGHAQSSKPQLKASPTAHLARQAKL